MDVRIRERRKQEVPVRVEGMRASRRSRGDLDDARPLQRDRYATRVLLGDAGVGNPGDRHRARLPAC
jgi:hypothetical protein